MSLGSHAGVPPLRLFAPHLHTSRQQRGEHLSEWMTLSAFFEAYVLPCYLLPRAKPATIAGYRTAVERWAKITGDPPLRVIDQATVARFVAEDQRWPGRSGPLSPNTVRDHCGYLRLILALAGPRTAHGSPWAATEDGLLGTDRWGRPREAPRFILPPARPKPPTDNFTLEEIRAWIAACEHASKPLGSITPADWWRALVRFVYNTGLRIGSVLQLEWSWVHEQNGWAFCVIPGSAYKGGRPKLIVLSPAAVAALEPIRAGNHGRIFHWPHTQKTLHRERHRLLRLAGLPPNRRFGFHGLRKATGTQLWRLDPDAAREQLGHSDRRITMEHYVDPSALANALANRLIPVLSQIPQP